MTDERLAAANKLKHDIRRFNYYLEILNNVKLEQPHNFPDSWFFEEVLTTVDKSQLQEILNLLEKDLTTKKDILEKEFAKL